MTLAPLTIHATPTQIRAWRSSRAWRALSRQVVHEEPTCHLRLPGCTIRSTTADHLVPAAHRPDLFMVRSNLRAACKSCNDLRRATPMNQLAKLRDPKYDPRRKQTPGYARRHIAAHRRPSRAANTFFSA